MSDLDDARRRYLDAECALETAGADLFRAIRSELKQGARGSASRVARELGWDRRRLSAWLKAQARRGEGPPQATGLGVATSTPGPNGTDGSTEREARGSQRVAPEERTDHK